MLSRIESDEAKRVIPYNESELPPREKDLNESVEPI
jgi:hypothetical protein